MGKSLKHYATVLQNRVKRKVKYANAHYFLDYKRVITKEFLKNIPPINDTHLRTGNYFIDTNHLLDANSIVYSFGILKDIQFDVAMVDKFDCSVFMYDPTPQSIEFMETHKANKQLRFFPKGVWTEQTVLKFFQDPEGGSASAVFDFASSDYFDAPCDTIDSFMKENGHSNIDVLKMDIEGAALPILEYMQQNDIQPKQIIVELERPKKDVDQLIDFFFRVNALLDYYRKNDYSIFKLPKEKSKYFSLELLISKNTQS